MVLDFTKIEYFFIVLELHKVEYFFILLKSLATLNNNKGIRQNPQSHHMLLYLPLIHSKTTKAVLKWQALSYPDIYGTNAVVALRIFFRVVTKKHKLYKI